MTPTLAWHFLPGDRRLRYGNGHLVEAGKNYTYTGPLKMCRVGMHASIDALDALGYAPGPIICRVEMGGHAISGPDKIVASERHVLWMADATAVLREFARWCASRATRTAHTSERATTRAARTAAQARAAAARAEAAEAWATARAVEAAAREAAWEAAREAWWTTRAARAAAEEWWTARATRAAAAAREAAEAEMADVPSLRRAAERALQNDELTRLLLTLAP